ncbi:MAG TPA: M4 family metallopeptidase, partial [Chitinispirillaceae bacterium]|nr:M4 family metallopeptidase [Chitinispirillaceae bacterium]
MGIFSKVFIALSLFSATSVLAIRSDDPDRNVLEGKSVDNLQKQNVSIRTAHLNDFRDQRIDGFSKQPQLGFNFTKSILDRVNPKLKSFDSEMKIESIQKDKYGITHIRMQQYHKNIVVSGGQIIVHMDKDHAIVGVTGKWAPAMSINATPSLSPTKAKAAITLDAGFFFKQEPTLIYFDNRLAYEYIIEGKKSGPVKDRYIVDAQSGEVLLKASLIKHAGPGNDGSHVQLNGESLKGEGSNTVTIMGWNNTNGNYFMYNKDSVWGVFNIKSSVNDWEQRTTDSWGNSDPAAVSLGHNLQVIQSCVMNDLGRKSFDDNNGFMKASVHEGTNYVNAYWDGESMYFGDGDGVSANALTVLDIVAHEYGHAVTQYSSNLDYLYESGALNESFSDISGTIVEFLSQPDGKNSYPKGTPGHGDWLCGEDAWLESDALRDLQNPNRFGQPSYYLGTNWYAGSGDNGGVHINSGVQNFAFYLLTEGGSGTNDGHPYNITGLGLNQASEIAMYANIYLLTSASQYRDSRDAWMFAATILGYDTATVSAVWTAVGLPPLEKHLAVTPAEINFGKI